MDIGIEIGMVLFQNDRSGVWKLKLFITFLFSYIVGGFLGASCYDPTAISGPDFVGAKAQALLVPATVLGAIATAWLVSLLRRQMNNELHFPPNFEGLVLGCIDADFCK